VGQAFHEPVPGQTLNLGKSKAMRESGKQESIMRVVIVAESGRLREGLQVMLDSFLALETVSTVEDGLAALEAMRRDQPDMVIVDADLFDEDTADWVAAIKQGWNGVHCLVVSGRLAQFQPLLDAGADKVLLKGFSAAELRSGMEQLLDKPLD
jgi:DNA-binding response OmpR family regulator